MAKYILRIIAGLMLIAAIVFVCCALANPGAGKTFYIGNWKIDATVWIVFYKIYLAIMVLLFAISFIVGNKKKRKAAEEEAPEN